MLNNTLGTNQFISDTIKDGIEPGKDLHIVQELIKAPTDNGYLCVVLSLEDDAFSDITGTIATIEAIRGMLQSFFYVDFNELINNGSSKASLVFECKFIGKTFIAEVSVDRELVAGAWKYDITHEFWINSPANDPFLTFITKLVIPIYDNANADPVYLSTVLENNNVIPQWIVPIQVASIQYGATNNWITVDRNKCNVRLMRTFWKFTDDKLCIETPATFTVSFTGININNCNIDQSIKNTFNKFISSSHPVQTVQYHINDDGIQDSVVAQRTKTIDNYIFDIDLNYDGSNSPSSLYVDVNMADQVDPTTSIINLSYSGILNNIGHMFNGLSIDDPSIGGLPNITGCITNTTNIICNMILGADNTPPNIPPTGIGQDKFDYLISDTDTGDRYVILNVVATGTNPNIGGGLMPNVDVFNVYGSLNLPCAVVDSLTYSLGNLGGPSDNINGKFPQEVIEYWSDPNINGFEYPVYNVDDLSNKIYVFPGCINN